MVAGFFSQPARSCVVSCIEPAGECQTFELAQPVEKRERCNEIRRAVSYWLKEIGQRLGVSLFGKFAVHYWIDSADRIMEITFAD